MSPNLTLQPSQTSQMLSLSDKYETYQKDIIYGNHRGKGNGINGKTATPASSISLGREPFKEVLADPAQLLWDMTSPIPMVAPSTVFQDRNAVAEQRYQRAFTPASIVEFDEPEKDKFDLMNIKIVVYGLNGLVCEKEPVKRGLFRRKSSGMSMDTSGKGSNFMGFSGSSISSGDIFSTSGVDSLNNKGVPTTAVVSCHKNAISSQTSLETFLPSMPIQRPIATFVNKVRYAASWPSEQSSLHLDDGSIDRSSFQIIRCMQQSTFIQGVGVGSNHIPETVELRINLSRGTELIRLGTATLVINGDEEGEVSMNIPAKPALLDARKMKKKKNKRNKYGYFSDDSTRRYFLDDNATLRVGIQVIPEEAVRFVQEKDKVKREQELKQILEQDDLKELLRQMGNDNLDRSQRIELRNLSVDMFVPAKESGKRNSTHDFGQPLPTHYEEQEQHAYARTSFSDMFCGAVSMPKMPAAFCVASSFTRSREECEIPMEIHTDQEIDRFAITSIISSVSESTDGSFRDFDDE
ncbi:hypothetical protein IV203_034977 [Nitzschia inconspicua]|uniref:Uncharacterized protein n=1 Tax=Nitzschia inconspicua TaxID=303405 RepID=A0A9K3PWP6_9STRA|nr:hypothetical protein IV203_034977 [Nitzschia inconspicua]